ncbi:MAG: RHS repeat-associated core domain-containing protein [Nitrospirae bacterium]|nr:RHS repeat-associated core domain-containing protein [Nitrospirota bacterium]
MFFPCFYRYDAIYRLKTAAHPTGNPAETFNYDSVGNRTSSHLSSSYTTDELNRLKEDNSYLYGYDADGNMISKTSTSTSTSTFYYFDAENKLIGVDKYASLTLTSTSTYSYDGFGRRVKKDVNGAVKFYIYDNEDIRFETDSVGAITAEYTHGTGIDEPLAMRKAGQNYYYHVNGLGSVTALTDSSKAVVQSYVYDSFEQIISQTGTITNPYTFTGREYDSETGMYYYRARYYSPELQRFTSEDPIGLAGGVNLYVYVGNNPVNWVDPLGLTTPTIPGYWTYIRWAVPRYFCNLLKQRIEKAKDDNEVCKELGEEPLWEIDPDAYTFLDWCYKLGYL